MKGLKEKTAGRLSLYHKYHNEIRMTAVFLGLILIPSGVLGYLSWRAIESEKALSQDRLRESYGQFARLAAREIDDELNAAEESWIQPIDAIFKRGHSQITPEEIENLTQDEPLIAAVFLLSTPGEVVYPPGVSLKDESLYSKNWENESYVREYELFKEMVSRGEELEYLEYDLDGAMSCYRQILAKVANRQFRAMAESYIGRALTKKSDWTAALQIFQNLLAKYPEVRDVNKMYLRFLAQYQMAVCLESLQRDQEAIATLLTLNKDLQERSDAINNLQYSFFLEQIQTLAQRLLSSPLLTDPASYQAQFDVLAEQSKKHISQKYFLQLLDRQLNKMIINRRPYREKFRYVSDEAEGEPFLLAYRALPDQRGIYTSGILALEIDLAELSQRLFPRILRNLKFSEQVALAILNEQGGYVIGTLQPAGEPIAVQTLSEPFDFWHVAIYLIGTPPLSQKWDFRTTLGFWLIGLLMLSILIGTWIFIRRARHEAYLSQMKSTFVSSVSHELRTPLTSINMLAELLEMQLTNESAGAAENLNGNARQYLQVIRREGERLQRLIENVLDFSKVEKGMKQYNFEYEDAGAVVRRAVESFRPHAEAQGFTLEMQISETLPEVRMDADAISQAVLNLLSNAVKYSEQVKKISVRAYQMDSQIAIEVADRGIGIEAADLPKIFDEFYRVDQRLNSQKQGGMGLGLTLVRHIVSAHGGDIKVQSEAGKGSTVTMMIPVPVSVKETG